MKELIKITEDGVDARELHAFLGSKYRFNDWIKKSIKDYGFKEGEDFYSFLSRSHSNRRTVEYIVSMDMAKELSMVAKTSKGKKARKYFIRCEMVAKKIYAEQLKLRMKGKVVRLSLTDTVRDSGENERMHGHGYSTYTNLAYKLTGIKKGDRDLLAPDDLKRLESAEALMKTLMDMGKEYNEIKDTLQPIFKEADNE